MTADFRIETEWQCRYGVSAGIQTYDTVKCCIGGSGPATDGCWPQRMPAACAKETLKPAGGGGRNTASRLSISSLSAVGITPLVLESLTLPSSDKQLQSMTRRQQIVMAKLFLGKDPTVCGPYCFGFSLMQL